MKLDYIAQQELQREREHVGSKLGLSREQLLLVLSHYSTPQDIKSLMLEMGLSNRSKLKSKYINPLIKEGLLEMTIPDKLNSSLQKYRLTSKGEKTLLPCPKIPALTRGHTPLLKGSSTF